jgi:hypothetical protein
MRIDRVGTGVVWSGATAVVNAVIGVVLTLAVVMWWVKSVGWVAESGCLAGWGGGCLQQCTPSNSGSNGRQTTTGRQQVVWQRVSETAEVAG